MRPASLIVHSVDTVWTIVKKDVPSIPTLRHGTLSWQTLNVWAIVSAPVAMKLIAQKPVDISSSHIRYVY